MQQPVDPLEPQGLPMDPREAAMLLLGMTASELKSIDEKVVSGRNSVGGIRSDINKIVSDIRGIVPQRPAQNNIQVPTPAPPAPVVTTAIPTPPPQEVQVNSQVDTVNDNSDQLEFDFYKKIKPEDLEYQLRLLKSSIDNIENKVNIILDLIKKKDVKKINGTVDQ